LKENFVEIILLKINFMDETMKAKMEITAPPV
jgi:hypothetical protein